MVRYDYIICGAGPAGCVLAFRLSETSSARVLLVEAGGGDRHPFIHIPAGFTKLSSSSHTWGYRTVPQSNMDNRELLLPQGRVLGGGSSINAMIYTRGSRHDYDEWASLGCDDWSYQKVLPYFVKAESNARLADHYHGVEGPQRVSDAVTVHPITHSMMQAAQEMGLPFTSDFNGEHQEGTGFYQTTTYRSLRASAATCYLKPALKRRNLTVLRGTTVLGVVIEHGRAVAIRIGRPDGAIETIAADSEILIAAGAIGSPKLLMLSGIGPADHLRSVDVAVSHNLPGVGLNLQDHLNVSVVGKFSGPYSYFGSNQWGLHLWWGLQYLLTGTGPLTTNASESGAFIKTDPALPATDAQLHFMTGPVIDPSVSRLAMYGITIGTNVSRPRSRGTLRLRSSDPDAPPLIDPNYLFEPEDMDKGVMAFRFARDMLQTSALAPFIDQEYSPGRAVKSREEIEGFIRRIGKTDYHPVGTCGMGVTSQAVVNQQLQVHGLEGLRVCDSSIMPTEITGNTNAPTIMIAERAADFIGGSRNGTSRQFWSRDKIAANGIDGDKEKS
jgi:choline dehydrogenase